MGVSAPVAGFTHTIVLSSPTLPDASAKILRALSSREAMLLSVAIAASKRCASSSTVVPFSIWTAAYKRLRKASSGSTGTRRIRFRAYIRTRQALEYLDECSLHSAARVSDITAEWPTHNTASKNLRHALEILCSVSAADRAILASITNRRQLCFATTCRGFPQRPSRHPRLSVLHHRSPPANQQTRHLRLDSRYECPSCRYRNLE